MAETGNHEEGGTRTQSVVSISLPLADVHSLYLACARLGELCDAGQFLDPSEVASTVDLLRALLPSQEMMHAIYNHMRRGTHGSTPRYSTSWTIDPA